jgi:rhodanese-related sulfurtransferase
MHGRKLILTLLTLSLVALAACGGSEKAPKATSASEVSGTIEGGLRVLTIDPAAANQHYKIYRGDYVRFALTTGEEFTIEIPDLQVTQIFPVAEGEKGYIKFPATGSFPFVIGDINGVIEALEFKSAAYLEVDAKEATELIANLHPVVLDVRTPGEYAAGHLPDAWLIPVQELQGRLHELAAHKNDPVFIYCRTGNRSTVAAKLLVDDGFTQVINLRKGIVDWAENDLPIVK